MDTQSIWYMPREIDRWERRFQDQARTKITKRRTRRAEIPFDHPRSHSRDQPLGPIAIIKANAHHFETPFASGPSRFGLQPNLKILRHLAFYCWERSALLDGLAASRNADALLALSAYWREWLRPLDEWQPPDGDDARQLGSLIRHLLARYDVPGFMDAAWRAGLTEESVLHQSWFRHIGLGGIIRTASGLPIALTKRMAHHFIQAPDGLGILAAFRYGQVLGLGGDERLARSLLGTRLATNFQANDFWETVICWMIEHPEVGPPHHGPIIDYVQNQKFVASIPSGLGRGHPRFVVPHPNLCMRGRTSVSLLRSVEEWHRRLGSRKGVIASWAPSGIPAFRVTEGNGSARRLYAITELIASTELEEEGAAMNHCVATYAARCQSGKCSIWSLTAEDELEPVRRLLTVEVLNQGRVIIQARGKCNRLPSADEIRILTLWAEKGGPSGAAISLSEWENHPRVADEEDACVG
jgi:hypothetical protein